MFGGCLVRGIFLREMCGRVLWGKMFGAFMEEFSEEGNFSWGKVRWMFGGNYLECRITSFYMHQF